MFISIFEHVLRAYRWNLLMESPKNKFSTFITTNVVIVSYFFALFIPRFNDFVRCYLISKTNNEFWRSFSLKISVRFKLVS